MHTNTFGDLLTQIWRRSWCPLSSCDVRTPCTYIRGHVYTYLTWCCLTTPSLRKRIWCSSSRVVPPWPMHCWKEEIDPQVVAEPQRRSRPAQPMARSFRGQTVFFFRVCHYGTIPLLGLTSISLHTITGNQLPWTCFQHSPLLDCLGSVKDDFRGWSYRCVISTASWLVRAAAWCG
jgi:hypothetical protein